jgi:triacylglycerol lipase
MSDATVRHHVVLVPGFVGFDALGQLEYYAGVTDVFVRWKGVARGVALHYFDNVPTASVELRGERLQKFLLKKMQRGEFGQDDRIALVGHSTGCLDIRKALHELDRKPSTPVDGAPELPHALLLERCQRLAFLSAPHFGTTLADGWSDLSHIIKAEAKNASLGIQLNRDYLAGLRQMALEALAETDLELAIADVLNESDERGRGEPQRTDEREARSELALWLEHMGRDVQIIGDLRSRGARGSKSPAHFDAAQRAAELQRWRQHGVRTRSYATRVSGSVQRDDLIEQVLKLLRHARPLSEIVEALEKYWVGQQLAVAAVALATSLPLLGAVALLHQRPALIFELFHAMCADPHHPFTKPAGIAPQVRVFGSQKVLDSAAIGVGQSDGVVNTLSMLWPYEVEQPHTHSHVLVEADHGDIIGHFKLRRHRSAEQHGRKYEAYDFFPSGSGFTQRRFDEVWTDVFDFCISS